MKESPSPSHGTFFSAWFPRLAGILLALLLAGSAHGQVFINEIMADNALSLLDEDGDASDWIELYNAGGADVNLAGWSIGITNLARTPNLAQWPFPATNLPAGGRMVIFASEKNRAIPGAPLHTNFKISKDGAKIGLAQFGLQQDLVTFGLQIKDKGISRMPDGTANWILATPTPNVPNGPAITLGSPFTLRINEWLATNSAGADEDWLELYNPDTNVVDLSGMIFSDNAAIPVTTTRILPPLTFIAGGAFNKFTCDNPSPYLEKGANHLNFSLSSSSGETLSIFRANDRTNWVDRVTFGPQVRDQSEGRLPDGSTNLFQQPNPLPKATPGESNFQKLTGVLINEALTHTDPPLEDAIELFNPNPYATNIAHWWLSNSKDDARKYRFPSPTLIPAFGFLVVYEMAGPNGNGPGFNPNGQGISPSFTLNSAHGDEVFLSTGDPAGNLTGYRRSSAFGSSENGVSFGRYVTSETNTEFVAMSRLSFGTSITRDDPPTPANQAIFRTGLGATNPYPKIGSIVLSEIMYHPPDIIEGTNHIDDALNEYVELYNITTQPVPLYDTNRYLPPDDPFDYRTNTWKLTEDINFTFPTNVVLPAGGSLLVVNFNPGTNLTQLVAFRSKYGVATNTPVFGPYGGKLGNGGGTVELKKPDKTQGPQHPEDFGFIPYILVERVKYSDGGNWPTNADGFGFSLQRQTYELFGNDPINWTFAAPTPGWQPIHIDSADHTPATTILHFTARAGSTYTAQFRDSLTTGNWANFATVPAQGSTRAVSATNSIPGGTLMRFYRVTSP